MNHKFSGILPEPKGQPQGIAPTIDNGHVGAILSRNPFTRKTFASNMVAPDIFEGCHYDGEFFLISNNKSCALLFPGLIWSAFVNDCRACCNRPCIKYIRPII